MNKLHALYEQYLQSNKKDNSFNDFFNAPTNTAYIIRHVNDPRSEDRQTLLHLAINNDDSATVDLLLKFKVNVNTLDKWGKSPIYRAAEGDKINKSIAKKLIENGANINEKDALRATALHWSVLAGNLQKTQDLLELGADINVVNRNLETPLRWALTRDIHQSEDRIQQKMVQLLFQKGPIICQDFTGIKISPGLTDNILVIGSTKLKDISPVMEPVTRRTSGFENAITTIEEFDIAVKSGMSFDFKIIEKATQNNQHPELIKLHERAKFYRMANEGAGIPTIKQNIVHSIAMLWGLADHASKKSIETKILSLPDEIQDLVIDESIAQCDHIPELKHSFIHNLAELWMIANEQNKKYIEIKISASPNAADLLNLFSEEKKIILELNSQKKNRAV